MSLVCTVQAETIDMGGFQIQVGEKTGSGTEAPEGVSPQPEKEQNSGKRQEAEMPAQSPESNPQEIPSVYWETEEQETTALPGEEAVWGTGEADVEEERAGEEILEVYQLPAEGAVTEETYDSGEGEGLQADPGTDTSGGDPEDHRGDPEETEKGKREENGGEDQKNPKSEEKEKAGERGRKKKKKVEFIHSSFSRLKPGQALSVYLKGRQEICVISYAVNHQECAFRWEGNRLIPVEPPFRKGMNSLEISVFSEEGRVISMEPWYFSCGVGSAML